MEVIIDPKSGFCFGVKRAIELAEKQANKEKLLYCLGEIVHNSEEVSRLRQKGIRFIDRETFFTLSNCKVLFRAHGEPPSTYEFARRNNIEIIDATCSVVLKLQEKVRIAQTKNPEAQVVIYGKSNHPEVIGLKGQVEETIILESLQDLEKVDVSKPVALFAQTTKDKKTFAEIKFLLTQKMIQNGHSVDNLITYNSICGQVSNRGPWLAEFSKSVDILIFVGGKNSSNSKVLFGVCKKENPLSYFVHSALDVKALGIEFKGRIGVSGATSTPSWLIEDVAQTIRNV